MHNSLLLLPHTANLHILLQFPFIHEKKPPDSCTSHLLIAAQVTSFPKDFPRQKALKLNVLTNFLNEHNNIEIPTTLHLVAAHHVRKNPSVPLFSKELRILNVGNLRLRKEVKLRSLPYLGNHKMHTKKEFKFGRILEQFVREF